MSAQPTYRSVELEAWALKKANGYGRDRWRFFVLEGSRLLYFQNPPREGQRGSIDLAEVETVYMFRGNTAGGGPPGDRKYLIEVRARSRVTVLYLPDWASLRQWQVLFTALGANRPVPPEDASLYKDYAPIWALDSAVTAPRRGSSLDSARIYLPHGKGFVVLPARDQWGNALMVGELKRRAFEHIGAGNQDYVVRAAGMDGGEGAENAASAGTARPASPPASTSRHSFEDLTRVVTSSKAIRLLGLSQGQPPAPADRHSVATAGAQPPGATGTEEAPAELRAGSANQRGVGVAKRQRRPSSAGALQLRPESPVAMTGEQGAARAAAAEAGGCEAGPGGAWKSQQASPAPGSADAASPRPGSQAGTPVGAEAEATPGSAQGAGLASSPSSTSTRSRAGTGADGAGDRGGADRADLGAPDSVVLRHALYPLWLQDDEATLADYGLIPDTLEGMQAEMCPEMDRLASSRSCTQAGGATGWGGGGGGGPESRPATPDLARSASTHSASPAAVRVALSPERGSGGGHEVALRLVALRQAPAQDFAVRVLTYRRHQDMYGREYVRFIISVHFGGLRWRISRRFRDFASLHDTLLRRAAGRGLHRPPRLPSKTLSRRVTQGEALTERQVALQLYLGRLLALPWAAQDVDVLTFLGAVSTARDEHAQQARLTVHLSRVEEMAEYGDIILFKCNTLLSQMQRRVTRAEWDHVGVVVQAEGKQQLLLLEATGEGVSLYPLGARLRSYSYEFARYMCLRRLRTRRNAVVLRALWRFADKSDGAPYKLTVSKLLRPQAVGRAGEDPKHYFCSELAATALNVMGALPDTCARAAFWPGDFASGGSVEKALQEATLEKEIMIDTSRPEVESAAVLDRSASRSRHSVCLAEPAHYSPALGPAQPPSGQGGGNGVSAVVADGR